MELRPRVFITPFHHAELTNAIFQRAFRTTISIQEAKSAYLGFQEDCEAGVWVLTTMPALGFSSCVELARKHVAVLGVRTLDTLHVACALELKADLFWTCDERQRGLAEAEGLVTA
jgi:predicted nucleic acid-binding protein